MHLDDFGTGYSSLAMLSRLALSSLKIDRLFVQEADKSDKNRTLLSSMINMARALQLKIIAEGVETQGQARFLKEQGVHQLQGWLYAPAMTPSGFESWLVGFSAGEGADVAR